MSTHRAARMATVIAAIMAVGIPHLAAAQDGPDVQAIDYGDDEGEWANDGECDDPRFSGPGVSSSPRRTDRMHDAADCRAAVADGTASLKPDPAQLLAAANITFGDDSSPSARNGECSDPRFRGAGMADEAPAADSARDATDCRVAFQQERIRIKGTGNRDSSRIVWGDDAGRWANDDECDDMRFTGEGMSDVEGAKDMVKHDANDCRAAFEDGRIDLLS